MCHHRCSWVSFSFSSQAAAASTTDTPHYSGIGLETSILFAKEGALLVMADINSKALDNAKQIVLKFAPRAKIETFVCDVVKEKSVEEMIATCDRWGGVDVVFNNAGMYNFFFAFSWNAQKLTIDIGIMHGDDDDAVNTPEKIWDLTQNINVKGVLWGSKHAIMSFRKHGKKSGSVINTASVVALVGSSAPQLAYTASKGAVLAMTRELAIVHAKEGALASPHYCNTSVEFW